MLKKIIFNILISGSLFAMQQEQRNVRFINEGARWELDIPRIHLVGTKFEHSANRVFRLTNKSISKQDMHILEILARGVIDPEDKWRAARDYITETVDFNYIGAPLYDHMTPLLEIAIDFNIPVLKDILGCIIVEQLLARNIDNGYFVLSTEDLIGRFLDTLGDHQWHIKENFSQYRKNCAIELSPSIGKISGEIAKYYFLKTGKELENPYETAFGVSIKDIIEFGTLSTPALNDRKDFSSHRRLDLYDLHITSLLGLEFLANRTVDTIILTGNPITDVRAEHFAGYNEYTSVEISTRLCDTAQFMALSGITVHYKNDPVRNAVMIEEGEEDEELECMIAEDQRQLGNS